MSATRPSDPIRSLEAAHLAPPAGVDVSVDLQGPGPAVAGARATFHAGRCADVAGLLLDLLPTAAAHANSSPNEQPAVKRQLADIHMITSELMNKVGNDPWPGPPPTRATQAAHDRGDMLTQAAASRQRAIMLRRAGHASTAQRLVVNTAAALQPNLHRGPDFLPVYGSLLSTPAYTAAVDGDRDTAHTHIHEAVDAANQLPTDGTYRFAPFDTSNVGVYQINIARTQPMSSRRRPGSTPAH